MVKIGIAFEEPLILERYIVGEVTYIARVVDGGVVVANHAKMFATVRSHHFHGYNRSVDKYLPSRSRCKGEARS